MTSRRWPCSQLFREASAASMRRDLRRWGSSRSSRSRASSQSSPPSTSCPRRTTPWPKRWRLLVSPGGEEPPSASTSTAISPPPARWPSRVSAALESRSPLENELIASLAPHYDVVARGRRLEKLEWPVYALLRPEFPDRLTIGPIDLTGPARRVYFGPYFALPAGVWSAHVSLEVQDCLSENRIGIDVFASKVLSVIHADLPPHGVYGCEVRFEIEDPSKPVEIRVQLLTGAIEGVILLRKIELHRLSSLDEVDEEDGLVRAE